MSSAPQYDNTNSGVMFGNFDSNEPKEDRKPNFDGFFNIDGKEYKIAVWVRYGKEGGKMAGRKFGSVKVERKSATTPPPAQRSNYDWKKAESASPAPRAETPAAPADFDDDIPFVFIYATPIGILMSLLSTVGSYGWA